MIDFTNIKSWRIGNTEIAKASINGVVVWQKKDDPYSEPFYVEDISGADNTLSIVKATSSAPTLTVQKSTDGVNWSNIGSTSTTAITATIPANSKLYLRCTTNAWSLYSYNSNRIKASARHNIGGNILSLLYGANFKQYSTLPNTSFLFSELFQRDTYLVNTKDVLLPSNATGNCYYKMFYGCTSLVFTPYLPATDLSTAGGCYSSMFEGCTSLETAPVLPATTLSGGCYAGMFSGCTALDFVLPFMLPAMNMVNQCYTSMFYGCTSLTTAPELPATTIRDSCYNNMFNGCTSLNEVMMMAEEWDMSDTYNWLNGVSESGTFILNKNATFDPVDYVGDASGIPQEWEIVPY